MRQWHPFSHPYSPLLNLGPRDREVAGGLTTALGRLLYSAQPDTLKRRHLGLGDLMVKPEAPAKLISANPVEQFQQAKRPEITRLGEFDQMTLRQISHWDVVLAKMADPQSPEEVALRASEATLRRELAEERKRFEDSVEMKTYERCPLWRIRTKRLSSRLKTTGHTSPRLRP